MCLLCKQDISVRVTVAPPFKEKLMENENKPEASEAQAEVVPKKMKVNVYGLFKELDALVREGFTEEELRGAFEEFIELCTGKYRPMMGRTPRPEEAGPYPTADEVNAIIIERATGKSHMKKTGEESKEELDATALMDTLNELNFFAERNTANANLVDQKALKDLEAILSPRKPSRVKMYAYRVAYYALKYPIRTMLYILGVRKPKYDDYHGIGFGGSRYDD
jgi:hypothetical protein